MILDINKRIGELQNGGLYSSNQMAAIKFAYFNLEPRQVEKILDKSIPAYYMSLYAILMQNGISVDYFLRNSYHSDEYKSKEIDFLYKQLQEFNKKNKELENSGSYSDKQLMALREAFKIIGEQVYLLIDYNISSEYITKYALLIKSGISVDEFIRNGYHLDENFKPEIDSMYMRAKKFNDTIIELENSGSFTKQQIDALKKAFVTIGDYVYTLCNHSIPSEYIEKYAFLACHCIDVEPYINSCCHLTDEGKFEIDELYCNIVQNYLPTQKRIKPSA